MSVYGIWERVEAILNQPPARAVRGQQELFQYRTPVRSFRLVRVEGCAPAPIHDHLFDLEGAPGG